MCGRFSLISSEELIKRIFRLNHAPVQPRFNIAPTQDAAVVRIAVNSNERELAQLRWGLIPPWSKDASIGVCMINAKSETVFEKPAFRQAARSRRCLIPADGFYEWKQSGGAKQAHYIYLKDKQPFAMAGLWEKWQSPDGAEVQSCTVLTTDANDLVGPIHHRMPVILPIDQHDAWLDPAMQRQEILKQMLRPYDAGKMAQHQVGSIVNNARNESLDCIKPSDNKKQKIEQDLLF